MSCDLHVILSISSRISVAVLHLWLNPPALSCLNAYVTSQFQPGHSLSSFCLHKDRKKPWSGLQRCIYPQIMQWKGVVKTSCSCFAAERSASRGGAVSQTQHQAQGPSGQAAGESRGPGMEPTPREGKPLLSALSAWLHNLPGSLTYLTPGAASVPGDGGSSVHSAAAESSDRSRLPLSWAASWRGEAAGCCSGPAADCGPAAGHQQH